LLKKLAEMDEEEHLFDRLCCSGSYLESMEIVCRGEVDAAPST